MPHCNQPQPIAKIGDKYYRVYHITLDGFPLYHVFRVTKLTPNGFRVIDDSWYHVDKDSHIVYNNAIKKFAHPSLSEAIIAFGRRKLSHVGILESRLQRAVEQLNNYNKMCGREPYTPDFTETDIDIF